MAGPRPARKIRIEAWRLFFVLGQQLVYDEAYSGGSDQKSEKC